MQMQKKLLLIAFVTGFCLMVFEMVSARLMSPFVGSAVYVWASIIGVIIAMLSLGYWTGGIIADKRHRSSDLAWLLLISASLICLTLAVHQQVLKTIAETELDLRAQAIFGSLLLFAPASFALGAISPYLVKLQTTSLKDTGKSVASLSALNSIGGVVGTFVAGFFLFSWIGARETLSILVVTLIALSWLISPRDNWRQKTFIATSLVFASLLIVFSTDKSNLSIDTATAHYVIRDYSVGNGPKLRGILSGNGGIQSGINTSDPDQLVFWYTRQLAEVVADKPNRQKILMLGGGTLTLPRYLADKYPDSTIDVVEIDGELADVARKYFAYDDPANVHLYTADARSYVAKTPAKYDIILVDTYNDGSVPFSLVTRQFTDSLKTILKSDGVVALNLIAGEKGACRDKLSAINGSYEAVFGQGKFLSQDSDYKIGNIIALYGPAETPSAYQSIVLARPVKMTDNLAPIERLTEDCRLSALQS